MAMTEVIVACIGAAATVTVALISNRRSSKPAADPPATPPPPAQETPEGVMRLRVMFIARVHQLGSQMLREQELGEADLAKAVRGLEATRYRGDAVRHLASWIRKNPPKSDAASASRERTLRKIQTEAIEYIRQDAEAWRVCGDSYQDGLIERTVAAIAEMTPDDAMCQYLGKWFDES
jgi:hypothetical protein